MILEFIKNGTSKFFMEGDLVTSLENTKRIQSWGGVECNINLQAPNYGTTRI
ncbi:hypothetical protein [Helicobacter sp. 16-1353]|uniref:hypothetical protein n=1 Tax=Helicobacter sp. 16-1353 TaxID=2004996 RepID=UPI0015EE4AA7|nr:hypothetical protein [Helicobacter sp. 16-1353]